MTSTSISAAVSIKQIGTVIAPIVLGAGAAVAATTNTLPLALAASGLLILLLIGLRSPVLLLALVAAFIPVQERLVFSGAGTATKFVGLVFTAAYVISRRQLPRLSILPPVGWAFVLWAVASGLWVVDSAAWTAGILTLVQLFALALVVGDLIMRNPRAADKVMWAYSVSALVTVFVLVAAPSAVGDTGRLTAFSDQDPAQFSAVLVPAFLFLVYKGADLATRPGAGRLGALLILAGAGLMAWGALVSGTVSSMVGLGVGMATMAGTGTGHRGGRASIVVVALVVAGAALLAPGVADSVLARLSNAVSTGGTGRQDIWAVGVTIFAQHPVIGVGYAGFPAAFTLDVIRNPAVSGLDLSSISLGTAPHSILFGTAAELGVVGIVLLGLFLWRVLSARSSFAFGNFVRVALIAMLAQAMFLGISDRKQLWLILGIAAGLAAAATEREADSGAQRMPPDARPASTMSSRRRSERPAAHAG